MSLRTFCGRLHRNVLAPYHLHHSLAELRALLTKHAATPEGWIAVTNEYQGRGWFRDMSAWQVNSEFLEMQTLVQRVMPAVVAEIGTAKGATLLGWCRMASRKVISVDLEGGIHGGGYPAIKQRLYEEFVADRLGVALHLIRADSHAPATKALAEEKLAGDRIDVLFIDGDHSYEGVSTDFHLWSPLVRSGGLVLFHDILPHTTVARCEVHRLWNELKPHYEHQELIENADQGWAGIGVLTMP